jgi:hypothetical protein
MWHLASEQCLFYKGMQLSDHSDLGDHGINEHALLLFRLRGSDEAELQGIQQRVSERMQADAEEGTQARAAETLLPIFIKGPTHGRSFSVEVPPGATIGAIKDAIERALGIPVQAQRLIFGSRHVSDMDLLVSHGVGRDSTLHLATLHKVGWKHPRIAVSVARGCTLQRDVQIADGGCTLRLRWRAADVIRRRERRTVHHQVPLEGSTEGARLRWTDRCVDRASGMCSSGFINYTTVFNLKVRRCSEAGGSRFHRDAVGWSRKGVSWLTRSAEPGPLGLAQSAATSVGSRNACG